MAATCHSLPSSLPVPGPDGRLVVLAGNPNVGKSALFYALTGLYAEVSNYPGTTVDLLSGRLAADVVMDTPGTYGLSPFSDDERVARDVILAADLVINVVDATHLERDLFLTLQLLDLGLPVLVALNMMDEARRLGLAPDPDRLASELGVAVVPMAAVRGEGVAELRAALAMAGPAPADACGHCAHAGDDDPAQCLAVEETRQEDIYMERRRRADALAARVVTPTADGASHGVRLGRLALHPVWGVVILAAVLWALYQAIGVWVAQDLVGLTEGEWMSGRYEPWVQALVGRWVSLAPLRELLVGEFGLLTMTVTYLLGLLLPLVTAFYLAVAVLEDSGYLPRIAVLADRLLTGMGLNGRAVIPLVLGLGCVTMATATTRVLASRRERQIATFLLALAIPCSAQLAVITAMVAPLGAGYTVAFLLVILGILGGVGAALNRILPGQSSHLLIDLPPLRVPRPGNVLRKTLQRTWGFMGEAGPIFALGALAVGVLNLTGVLSRLQAVMQPLTAGWLRLPPAAATAFVMGFVRRDFGAAGLYDLHLSPGQSLVALVVITLFVPCIAALMMIIKERGRREGATMWVAAVALAFLVGGLIARLLPVG